MLLSHEFKNGGTVSFGASNIKLLTKNGTSLNRTTLDRALREQQFSIAKTIVFGFPGASQAKAAKANVMIENHFNNNLLSSGEIPPKSSKKGLVYFDVPNDIRNIANWTIHFSIRDSTKNLKYETKYTFGGKTEIIEK